jgi:hypothetical protein
MGGPRSSRWGNYRRRPRVEQAPVVLTSTELGRLKPGTSGTVRWTHGGETYASVPFTVQEKGTQRVVSVQVHVAWGEDYEIADQVIQLVPLPMPQGGVRWLAMCPLCRERRVLKLYIPRDGVKLMCRTCAGLLYTSSQKSDPRISALRANPRALDVALAAPRNDGWAMAAVTAHWKEQQRLLRWLDSRDPVQKLRALAYLNPPLATELLREVEAEVGATPREESVGGV